MNFIALDLELNNQPEFSKNPKYVPEIIQVGVCVGNLMDGDNPVFTDHRYVKTKDPIDPFITKLTGITDEDVQSKGIDHTELRQWLLTIKQTYNIYTPVIQWGIPDLPMLRNEFVERDLNCPFGRRFIDVKSLLIYESQFDPRSFNISLGSALKQYKIKPNGTAHQADADAENTLRLFFKLLKSKCDS